ncbi:iron response transcriptional regulator IrrA [Sneathiella glossodoripedis]|uniref:iron response transcriptional regulator IrrA n=1 Tax=Sneathiella glossodoripedis TaxID=418853 RepID=UPI000472BA4D|nr:Fur family transcriptional regulator [Sneathiella glossodoripedis]
MPDDFSSYEALIRAAGLRPTKQRMALASALFADGNRHITAEELHKEVSSYRLPLSLATVYNNLHQFTKAGLLREVIVDSSKTYFDTNTSPHHHLYYENEGRLEDIQSDNIRLRQLPELPEGVDISSVDIFVRVRSNPTG